MYRIALVSVLLAAAVYVAPLQQTSEVQKPSEFESFKEVLKTWNGEDLANLLQDSFERAGNPEAMKDLIDHRERVLTMLSNPEEKGVKILALVKDMQERVRGLPTEVKTYMVDLTKDAFQEAILMLTKIDVKALQGYIGLSQEGKDALKKEFPTMSKMLEKQAAKVNELLEEYKMKGTMNGNRIPRSVDSNLPGMNAMDELLELLGTKRAEALHRQIFDEMEQFNRGQEEIRKRNA